MSPRIREQALPEKRDDRFFDRWVVDKAREHGARAVKRSGLEKLKRAVHAFAEWRSLRHGPAAERENMADKALVASTPAMIEKAKAEAERLTRDAEEAEGKAADRDREAEVADEKLSAFRPALRGSEWDFVLTLLANVVVFAVDIFVIHVALGRIPGNEQEYWLTAITMGAGAVVIGDALGWMAAAGSIRKDGAFGRPGRPVIAAVAVLLILAIWFFVQLGDFREFGIVASAHQEHVQLAKPSFFTIAQIVFLLAAAVVCFAYLARRSGRELLDLCSRAVKERDRQRAEAKSLRARAEQARRAAAEAPALRKAAEERIRSREKVAEGDAEHDLKQGEYLENLIEPEYMKERADVESGVRYWQMEGGSKTGRPLAFRIAFAVGATLAAGAIAFWVIGSVLATVLTSVVVAAAFALAGIGRDTSDESFPLEHERRLRYVAQFIASVRKGSDRATDIERLVPFPTTDPESDSNGNGNGNGHTKRQTREELTKMVEKARKALGDE